MRFVRAVEWSQERPKLDAVTRCPTCMEGNNVNPDAESRAIAFYLSRRAARQHTTQDAVQ